MRAVVYIKKGRFIPDNSDDNTVVRGFVVSGVTFVDDDGNPIDEFTGMSAEAGLKQIKKDEIHEVQFEEV